MNGLIRMYALWATAALLLVSCSGGRRLSVSDTNFGEVIETTQNLVFHFNRDVVKEASDQWLKADLVSFSPAVPGRFKWVGKDELLFSPAVGFRPSTSYSAKLTESLSKVAQEAVDQETEIPFHTQWLQIMDAQAWWTPGDRPGAVVARCRLQFNYRVDAQRLKGLLQVKAGDEKIGFEILDVDDKQVFTLSLLFKNPNESHSELKFEVEKGLKCEDSNYKSEEILTFAAELPDPKVFEVQSVQTEVKDGESIVRVRTTHTPNAAVLTQAVSVVIPSYWGENQIFSDYRIQIQTNGFDLTGAFNIHQEYRLKLGTQLQSFNGIALAEAEEHDLEFNSIKGKVIQFASQDGMYLSRTGNRYIGVNVINVPEVSVKIAKVYENNIVHFMRQNRGYNYNYDDEQPSREAFTLDSYYDIEHFGEVLSEQKYKVDELGIEEGQRLLKIDFDDIRKRYRGAFIVEVSAPDEYYLKANKMLVISDLGLSLHKGQDGATAFVHQITDANPQSGVELALISSNNQTMATRKSDGKGAATFELKSEETLGFRPSLLTAKTADDFSFLALDYSQIQTSRFDVGGKATAGRSYDAWIYGPREIYRPGETIAFNSIVRTFSGETPKEMPVEMRLIDPSGSKVSIVGAKLNAEGAYANSIALPRSATTGSYTLELRSGADEVLATQELLVEEFVPDRIRVQAQTPKTEYTLGETANLALKADYFFGPPAAMRNYEVELQVSKKDFRPEGFDKYVFNLTDETKLESFNQTGQTDGSGQAQVPFLLPQTWEDAGMLSGKFYTTVFDETGKPVRRFHEVNIQTQSLFYGLGKIDTYVSAGQAVNLPVVAVTAGGQQAKGVYARVRVLRYEWTSHLERVNGSVRYKSQKRSRVVHDRLLSLANGNASLNYMPSESGEYEVQVARPGAKSWVSRKFYAYFYGSTSAQSFGINTEGKIDMVSDKTTYETGEEAKILFKTPFDGRLIVRIENRDVIEHRQIETENRAAEVRFTFKDGHVPNVYVAATLIRPVQGENLPLTVAHGYLPLLVNEPKNRLAVKITAPKESRSLRVQTISVQTEPGAELTISAVDEGIMQLRNTPSPDPHGWLYARRALEVEGFDGYGYQLPEMGRNFAQFKKSSTGAGGGYEDKASGQRNNPFASNRIKPLALWSGVLKADANGQVNWKVALPQFSGAVRIMVSAYKGRKMGMAAQEMIVSDPIVISTALPRFLSAGDTLTLPITIFNNEKKDLSVTASLQVKGPLKVLSATKQSTRLAASGETQVVFSLAAGPGVGQGEVNVLVLTGGETFQQQTEITIRPAAPLQKRSGSGSIAAGKSAEFKLAGSDFIAGTQRGRLVISKLPVVELGRSISELVNYPHGCAEQTISTAFPQLYLTELSSKFLPPNPSLQTNSGPAANVRTAIRKIENLTGWNGEVATWEPGGGSSPWTSIYAAHFLLEAQKAGYEVSEDNLNKLLKNVASVTGRHNWNVEASKNPYYFGEASRNHIYAAYVLALSGRKPLSFLNLCRERVGQLLPEQKYMLACAFRLAGDVKAFEQLLPSKYDEYKPATVDYLYRTSYASPLRDRALVLSALLEADPNHSQIAELARQVSTRLKNTQYPTTQELAFALSALGRMAKSAAAADVKATITVGERVADAFTGTDWVQDKNLVGQTVSIRPTGGTIYYYWETEGVSASGNCVAEDKNMMVRKAFFNRNGVPLGNELTQGELVVVRLSVSVVDNESLPDVILTDLFPAGFEPENPRITQSPEFAWIADASSYEHIDIRDDRVHFFADLPAGGVHHFYYAVRVVSPGRFRLGPVSAEAMYDPSYRSAADHGVVRVSANANAAKVQ